MPHPIALDTSLDVNAKIIETTNPRALKIHQGKAARIAAFFCCSGSNPNLRELPLSSDVPNSVKNHPPPWTSELNLNYPTKDKVITMTLLTVVIILMVLMVL